MMRKVKQGLLFLLADERGITKILVALSIVVLFGFTALVVDAGAMYAEKSKLQKALDAAVLGGAQSLVNSHDEARTIAKDIASKNGIDVSLEEVIINTDEDGGITIEIGKTRNKKLTFARVLGLNDADVYAFAQAKLVTGLVNKGGIVPVWINNSYPLFEKDIPFAINLDAGEGEKGNYGFLDFDTNIKLEDEIIEGSKKIISVNDVINTDNGLKWGQVRDGFNDRIIKDKDKPHCSSYTTADSSCSRLVILVVTKNFDSKNGTVIVSDFAVYWIDKVDDKNGNHKVIGYFIDYFTQGTFDPSEYGEIDPTKPIIYGVKLTK